MKENLSGSYSDKDVTIIGNAPITKALKTCYRCGKTYNAETPYCEDCMDKISAPKPTQAKRKVHHWSIFDILIGCVKY